MKISSHPSIFVLLSLCTLALSSCSFWKSDRDVSQLASPSRLPAKLPSSPVSPTTETAVPPLQPSVTQTWVLKIDSNKTRGAIDLSIDPKGSMLGRRSDRDTAALKGSITVVVKTDSSTGKRRISVKDIHLTNIRAYHMDYAWGALIGQITVDIAPGVLKIKPNDFSQSSVIAADGSFAIPQCYFTVRGDSQVDGHGLVLHKAVPKRNMDLTMKKTQQVTLRGEFNSDKKTVSLHIPRAVMRDEFDYDGTKLGLVFTADIAATGSLR
ncbi:hypothetical protein JO972_08570 [Verrucomicrobiaceae bacterium 5K15]|uniref:Lipid/polyisoprenoid-binding YceI-like domain-containing protein n=1 Tax=Oceaniferula flava TaxID=2800421 RepID=A0AAE2SEE5_9BACT|nr:hypothetical protein [Oceaniferula flavus]MBK1855010.1 hypothetical protein [Oceaniferula flavus]MBM1136316.1 hypothetical protein [Oceaniferula flavus]